MTVQDYIYGLICNALENAELNHYRHKESFHTAECSLKDQYGDSGYTYSEILQASQDEICKATLAKTWIEGGGEI
jgi:hypothetical protein